MRMPIASALLLVLTGLANAEEPSSLPLPYGSEDVSTRHDASGTATDSTYVPLYQNDGGVSAGVYGTTTTTGGYQEGGSGQAIPDNTSDSSQHSSGGVYFEDQFGQ